MKNLDVIVTFVNGGSKAKTNNLYIENDKLFNYNTCIAERYEKLGGELGFIVNATKYSQSTTTIQNKLMNEIPEDQVTAVLTGIRMGERDLSVN